MKACPALGFELNKHVVARSVSRSLALGPSLIRQRHGNISIEVTNWGGDVVVVGGGGGGGSVRARSSS